MAFIIIAILSVLCSVATPLPSGGYGQQQAAPAYGAPVLLQAAPAPVPILQHDANVNEDGSYKFSYTSGDQSQRQEQSDNYQAVKGSYAYISPEGEKVDIYYTADENGYQAFGAAIPTPVPNHYPLVLSMGVAPPKYSAPKYHVPAAAPQY
uniref:Uncharacterized protein n=1 Tax=Strigamia maritima TaxID=126957 RepID=T1IZG5_STRMM